MQYYSFSSDLLANPDPIRRFADLLQTAPASLEHASIRFSSLTTELAAIANWSYIENIVRDRKWPSQVDSRQPRLEILVSQLRIGADINSMSCVDLIKRHLLESVAEGSIRVSIEYYGPQS
jgi:hypothetical protein